MLTPYEKPSKLIRIFVLISQGCNVVFFDGYPDEMFSARCYREKDSPLWESRRKITDKVFFWQQEHCKSTFEWEQSRKDLPEGY